MSDKEDADLGDHLAASHRSTNFFWYSSQNSVLVIRPPSSHQVHPRGSVYRRSRSRPLSLWGVTECHYCKRCAIHEGLRSEKDPNAENLLAEVTTSSPRWCTIWCKRASALLRPGPRSVSSWQPIKRFLVDEIANGVDVFLSSSSNISSCLKCECLSNRNQNFLVLGEGITTGGPTEPWFLEVGFDQDRNILWIKLLLDKYIFGSNYCLTNTFLDQTIVWQI